MSNQVEIGWKKDLLEESEGNVSESKRGRDRDTKKQKKYQRLSSRSSSSSSNSSSSDSCSSSEIKKRKKVEKQEKRKKRKEEKRLEKEKRRAEKAEKKQLKKARKAKRKEEKKLKKSGKHSKETIIDNDKSVAADYSIPLELMNTKARAPETPQEYEARQNQIRRVFDADTGRTRLIKGDGEILEEIVSRDRHKEINRQSTHGDGNYFQTKTVGWDDEN